MGTRSAIPVFRDSRRQVGRPNRWTATLATAAVPFRWRDQQLKSVTKMMAEAPSRRAFVDDANYIDV